MTDSPTPRTDALISKDYYGEPCIKAEQLDDVCQLERELAARDAELAEARRDNEILRSMLNLYNLGGWTDSYAILQRAEQAEARAAANEKDATIYRYLQSIPVVEAQAFFWNHKSRKQREQAIVDAMQGGRDA